MKMILSLQFLLTAASCKTSINILHFNDVHSRVEPANRFASSCSSDPTSPECFGGMARQKTVIDQIRNSSSYPTIVLDAGDEFMGTLWNTFYQGDAAAELQNLMELDAMELGNHEFDFGEDVLLDYLRQLEIPVLGACNIITNNTELAGLIQKWTIKKFPSFKVGIVGALTTDTSFSSSPGPQTKFQDLVPSLNDCILEMKRQENVDIVIALTHVGIFEDEKIAKNVEGVDMVIGGHTHSFLYSPTDNTPILLLDEDGEEKRDTAFADYPVMFDSVVTQGKKVPVFQAYWANRYMGNFIATFDDKFNLIEIEGQPILLNYTIDFDPEAQEIIDELKVPLATYSQNIIGKISVLLDGAREVVRSTESSLGNSICDGILWYINNRLPEFEQDFGAVDIAVQNGGGIRASIEQGDISVGNVQEVLPFGNTVSITAMTGVDIIGMLENSVKFVEVLSGRFLQVSGIKYAFDPSLASGSRIVGAALVVDGSEVDIDPCSTYNVASNNFVASGGDEFTMIASSQTLIDIGPELATVYQQYISFNSPISAQVEDRIINCMDDPDAPLCDGSFAPLTACN